MRKGTARLPLHGGKCPAWLFEKMQRLGALIMEVVLLEYGAQEVLRRLSDPHWFQALGCVLGYDWHSSGVTTTTCAALKEGLRDRQKELGLFIAGGKGNTALQTPREIEHLGSRFALQQRVCGLQATSRLVAKVDNTALQDGFDLYHHTIFFTSDGSWAVVQQGMNGESRWARRYHWLGEQVSDFVSEPHQAVCCDQRGDVILNMVARESEANRQASLQVGLGNPEEFLREWSKIKDSEASLHLPREHALPQGKRIAAALYKAHEEQPADYTALLSIQGMGPQTIRAISLVAELSFGAPSSRKDPARYSFAHGGKDGHPYPVDRENYRRSIHILEEAVSRARIGNSDKMRALKRLAELNQEKGVDG